VWPCFLHSLFGGTLIFIGHHPSATYVIRAMLNSDERHPFLQSLKLHCRFLMDLRAVPPLGQVIEKPYPYCLFLLSLPRLGRC